MLGTNPLNKRYQELKDSQIESSISHLLKNCEFWIWDESIHEKLFDTTGGACCFWHIIGLPEKEHLVGKKANGKEILESRLHGMKKYENEQPVRVVHPMAIGIGGGERREGTRQLRTWPGLRSVGHHLVVVGRVGP